jgi:hypothetical protein
MNSCDKHSNCIIVYSNYDCPVCEMESTDNWEIEKRDNKINELESEISDLKVQLENK